MNEEKQEMTPEEYKTQVLKRNFAARLADYEDAIADLQTQNAMLMQQLRQVNGQAGADSIEEAVSTLSQPPPPPDTEE